MTVQHRARREPERPRRPFPVRPKIVCAYRRRLGQCGLRGREKGQGEERCSGEQAILCMARVSKHSATSNTSELELNDSKISSSRVTGVVRAQRPTLGLTVIFMAEQPLIGSAIQSGAQHPRGRRGFVSVLRLLFVEPHPIVLDQHCHDPATVSEPMIYTVQVTGKPTYCTVAASALCKPHGIPLSPSKKHRRVEKEKNLAQEPQVPLRPTAANSWPANAVNLNSRSSASAPVFPPTKASHVVCFTAISRLEIKISSTCSAMGRVVLSVKLRLALVEATMKDVRMGSIDKNNRPHVYTI